MHVTRPAHTTQLAAWHAFCSCPGLNQLCSDSSKRGPVCTQASTSAPSGAKPSASKASKHSSFSLTERFYARPSDIYDCFTVQGKVGLEGGGEPEGGGGLEGVQGTWR